MPIALRLWRATSRTGSHGLDFSQTTHNSMHVRLWAIYTDSEQGDAESMCVVDVGALWVPKMSLAEARAHAVAETK